MSGISTSRSGILNNLNRYNAGVQQQVQDLLVGAEIEARGHRFQAQGLRQTSQLIGQAAAFNMTTEMQNTVNNLNDLNKSYSQMVSTQVAQQAGSGFSTNSNTFNLVRNESLNSAITDMTRTKIAAENKRRATEFETNIAKTNLENQARAADYNAQVTTLLAHRQAAQMMQGAMNYSSNVRSSLRSTTSSFF